jgi:hypothetical protein
MVTEIIGRKVPIDAYLDSKTVFDTVTRMSPTLENRLLINVYAVQEAHQRGELRSIYWIPSAENLSDPLTKSPVQPKRFTPRLSANQQDARGSDGLDPLHHEIDITK